MNNFLHTFFSPILYFDLFGGFGYILLGLIIILLILNSRFKGTAHFINWSVQSVVIIFFFIFTGLPIEQKDENLLREQMSYFALETVEDPELKQEKQKILREFSEVTDKGYINRLEEADTYKKLVEFNRNYLEEKNSDYLEAVQHKMDQQANAQH